MHIDTDVHSIQQRPGQTREVPASIHRRTGAPTPTMAASAGAGIGCHHQLKGRGIARLNARAVKMNNTGFKGLAQGIKNGGSEFRGLVKKKNPSVRQRRRPGDEHASPATDEGRHRHGMMGCLEGRPGHQRDAGWQQTRHRMQRRGDESGIRIQIGKNRGQARREHRLTGARFAQQKHMMSSRCCHLERRHGLGLPADVTHIKRHAILSFHAVTSNAQPAVERRFDCFSPSPCNQVCEVREIKHLDTTHQPGLLGARRGHNHPTHPSRPGCQNGGQHATNRLDATIEPELPNDDSILKRSGRHESCSQSDGRGNRQIERRSGLWDTGGRQVHGDALVQHIQSARLERCPYTIARLAH